MARKIDYRIIKEALVAWFKYEFYKGGGKYAVLGISGGKDSTIAAAIAVEALGADHVLGIMLPNGKQADIDDSIKVCETLGIMKETIDINNVYDIMFRNVSLSEAFKEIVKREGKGQMNIAQLNTPPRIRMTQLRAFANSIPGGRLINTSNLSEFFMGYFTKDGDSCGDLFPLLGLTKSEVVEIGLCFKNIPKELIEKAPADGLTGSTDEEVLGTEYECIDQYITSLESGNTDDAPLLTKDFYIIKQKHEAAAHKLTKNPIFFYDKKREDFVRNIK